jgi:hypothetical protein
MWHLIRVQHMPKRARLQRSIACAELASIDLLSQVERLLTSQERETLSELGDAQDRNQLIDQICTQYLQLNKQLKVIRQEQPAVRSLLWCWRGR